MQKAVRSLVLALALFAGCSSPAAPDDAGALDSGGDATSEIDARAGDTGTGCDGDGDGSESIACGGDDCDDADAARHPGALEVCDAGDVDEDCDPTTFGARDADSDGFVDVLCCNADGAASRCGDDCDDMRASAHPTATESCDLADDDCDGAIDESLSTLPFRPDCDGDGYGDSSATPVVACGPPASSACAGAWVSVGGDCDDEDASRNSGNPEVCNGIDDDCDARIDDIIDGVVLCAAGQTRPCRTSCGIDGVQPCNESCLGWGACTTPEICNGCDDDDDGADDEDFECVRGASGSCTVPVCGTTGTRLCGDSCAFGSCTASEACNYCDDDGDGNFYEERPLATVSTSPNLIGCSGADPVGPGASCDVVRLVPEGDFDIVAELLDGTAVPQSGAMWFTPSMVQGWGPTDVDITVELTAVSTGSEYELPLGGWGVVIAYGGAGGTGDPAFSGIPFGVSGVAARWTWSDFYTCPSGGVPYSGDAVRAYAMGPGAALLSTPSGGPDSGCHSGELIVAGSTGLDGVGETITQRMHVRYTPDDPTTSAINEEEVVLSAITGTGTTTLVYTGSRGAVPIGAGPLRIGVTAGTHTASGFDGYPPDAVFGVPVRARVRVMEQRAAFVGPPTITYPQTASAQRVCP